MKLLYHLLAIATVCIWGTTFVSTKILLQAGLTPAALSGAALILLGIAWARHKR